MKRISHAAAATAAIVVTILASATGCQQRQFLSGYFTPEQFADTIAWKRPVATDYRIDPAYRDSLAQVQPFTATLFIGTWCHDSQREVPRLLALRQYMPLREVQIVAIDTAKRDERGLARQYGIRATPTFVFERDGHELGRYVERPPKGQRMEQAIYHIVR